MDEELFNQAKILVKTLPRTTRQIINQTIEDICLCTQQALVEEKGNNLTFNTDQEDIEELEERMLKITQKQVRQRISNFFSEEGFSGNNIEMIIDYMIIQVIVLNAQREEDIIYPDSGFGNNEDERFFIYYNTLSNNESTNEEQGPNWLRNILSRGSEVLGAMKWLARILTGRAKSSDNRDLPY